MDIGGLETVVANSAYVSARGSADASAASTLRDKKMRAKLKLPHITQCEPLRTQLDLDFQSICLRQPIGKRLFQQFLEEQEAFAAAGGLWKSVEDYAAAEESERPQKAQKTVNRFFDSASKTFCAFLEEKAVMRVKEDAKHGRADLFQETERQLLKHLEERALAKYKDSLFFSRFLQFKWLEGQSVSEEWFLDFRVLGKGGFGEVCACQMKATGKMYANKKLNKKRLKKRNGYEARAGWGSPDAWVLSIALGGEWGLVVRAGGLGARTPGFSPRLWEGSGGWWGGSVGPPLYQRHQNHFVSKGQGLGLSLGWCLGEQG
uniref:RGS domain-containing protein n=1 Tax=Chrysemys picta bellii TaxID=8478 RepID=A0A8C3IED9_CHRPI